MKKKEKEKKKTSFSEPSTGVNCNASKDKYALDMRIGGAFPSIPLHIGCSVILSFLANSATMVGEPCVGGAWV